jgi:hypothetical protein
MKDICLTSLAVFVIDGKPPKKNPFPSILLLSRMETCRKICVYYIGQRVADVCGPRRGWAHVLGLQRPLPARSLRHLSKRTEPEASVHESR